MIKEKDYYTISEIWELQAQIEEEIGTKELLENLVRWLGAEDCLKAFKSIATDFDLWDYEED